MKQPELKGNAGRIAGKLSELIRGEKGATAAALLLQYKSIEALRADVETLHTLLSFEPLELKALPDLDTLELPSYDGLQLPDFDTLELPDLEQIPLPDFDI